MSTDEAVPAWRRIGASAAMGASALGLGVEIARSPWFSWYDVLPAVVMGGAAVGLSRKGLLTQALSRGTAWVVFAPTAIVAVATLIMRQRLEAEVVALATGTGLALLLGHPMLNTAEARVAFAPVRFRRWFLASATATAAAFMTVGAVVLDLLRGSHVGQAIGLAALGISLLGSLVGILRMRGWAPLLAAATSIATLLAAAVLGGPAGAGLALAAIPGLLMAAPLVLSRVIPAAPEPQLRVEVERSEPFTRVRVAPVVDAEFPSADDDVRPALARRA